MFLRSSRTITLALLDQGFQLLGLLGPNKVIDSLFTEAAICDATESRPIKNLDLLMRAARPKSLVLPARFNTCSSIISSFFSISSTYPIS